MANEIMTIEEAVEMLKSKMDGHTDTSYEWAETVRMAIKALEQQPKTGHWINLGVMPSDLGAYRWCSNCGCGIDAKEFHRNHYNFCPNCGADMGVMKYDSRRSDSLDM